MTTRRAITVALWVVGIPLAFIVALWLARPQIPAPSPRAAVLRPIDDVIHEFMAELKRPSVPPFARVGQWITGDGDRRVCQLAIDLRRYEQPHSWFCTEWANPWEKPFPNTPIPQHGEWMRVIGYTGVQYRVEGRWVP